MKIGFIGPLPPPLGGVAVINKSLQQIDYAEHKIVAFNTSSESSRERLYEPIGFVSFIRNIQLFFRLFRFIWEQRPYVCNIFITSGPSILRDILFLAIIRLFDVPVVVHFHSKTVGEFALKPWRLRFFSTIIRMLSRKILVQSDSHYAFFSKYFGKSKCGILENFVRYQDFSCSIDQKKDRFLFIGRLTKEKGFYDLLSALKILREKDFDIQIDVVGVGQSEDEESHIQRLISEYDIRKVVHLHGAKFGQDKFELFKQSKCLIFPSRFENSPVVIKEAMAAKMGIIASDISANTNILAGLDNSLIFKVGDIEQLADRIIEIIHSPELSNKLCNASASVTKYDEPAARRKMLDFIAEVTSHA